MKKAIKRIFIIVCVIFMITLVLSACDSGDEDTYTFPTPETEAGHTHTFVKKNEIKATCTEGGNNACWICYSCGKVYSDENGTTETTIDAQNVAALGHDYGEVTYTWNDDNTACTATRVCKNDSSHVETETVSSSVTPISSSCTTAGQTNYKATFENSAFEEQTKQVPTSVLGHDYTEVIRDMAHLRDSGDCQTRITYWYDCSRCDTNAKEDANATSMFYTLGKGEHVPSTEWSREEGWHYRECTVSGCDFKVDYENCHGGEATCTDRAVCAECGESYGEKNRDNHSSTEFTYENNNNGWTHTKKYACCDTVYTENEYHTFDDDECVCGYISYTYDEATGIYTVYAADGLQTVFDKGGYVKLGDNIYSSDYGSDFRFEISKDVTVTLDLNGKYLSLGDYTICLNSNAATLNVLDSGTDGYVWEIKVISGTLNLESGYIDDHGIYLENGTVNIKGGKVGNYDGIYMVGGTLNVTGGEICGIYIENGNVTVDGGTNPNRIRIVGGKVTMNGGAVYEIRIDDGELIITGGTIYGGGDGGIEVKNGKVTISGDVTVTGIDIDGGTVDINGGTISGTEALDITGGEVIVNNATLGGIYIENGKLTINGGTVGGIEIIGGELIINEGATVGTPEGAEAIVCRNGKVTINGGEIISSYIGIEIDDGELVVTGGTINGGLKGINSDGGKLSISGGTVIGTDASMLLSGAKEVIISGGTFNGFIYYGSSTTVTGGNFSNDPTYYVDTDIYDVTLKDEYYTVTPKQEN